MQGLHITGIASRELRQYERKGAARTPGGPFALPKRARRMLLALASFSLAAALITATQVAAAASITEPSRSPYTVAADLAAIPVVATGFTANANVFVEQCDGTPPSDPRWSPTVNCDLGSSPPPASADSGGTASFQGQRAFRPFVGESPQALFNCVGARMHPPANRLQSFDNCQLRVSTNNSTRTTDQVFLTLVLPSTAPPPTTTPSSTVAPTASARAKADALAKAKALHTSATDKARATTAAHAKAAATATTLPVTATTRPGRADAGAQALGASGKAGSERSHTDSGAAAGFALIAVGAAVALAALLVGRGIGRVAHR